MQASKSERDEIRQEQDRDIADALGRIKHKILVMSGKGGVGKSSMAVNVAVGLANQGHKVGLMDVDLHGPSIPQMLGMPGLKESRAAPMPIPQSGVTFWDNRIIPALYSKNLFVVSMESMMENIEDPVIWRGPLKISAIRQFISDVQWNSLDYLVIDSPPGTGDEPLTVAQTIPDAKAVIVTTPQVVSLRDVRKSINFCRKTNLEILGMIENMSGFVCPKCGEKMDLFKVGGGEKTAQEMKVPFLGKIPIIPAVVQACDNGVPAITASKDLEQAMSGILESIARNGANSQASALSETRNKESSMKIAVPMAEKKLSMHFGHCEEFALIDVDENEKKITKQEVVPAPEHQPGLLPRWLHEKGANVIIAGGMGSRAQGLFSQNGIQVVVGAPPEAPEKIVTDYLNGSLVTGGNVCDH